MYTYYRGRRFSPFHCRSRRRALQGSGTLVSALRDCPRVAWPALDAAIHPGDWVNGVAGTLGLVGLVAAVGATRRGIDFYKTRSDQRGRGYGTQLVHARGRDERE